MYYESKTSKIRMIVTYVSYASYSDGVSDSDSKISLVKVGKISYLYINSSSYTIKVAVQDTDLTSSSCSNDTFETLQTKDYTFQII